MRGSMRSAFAAALACFAVSGTAQAEPEFNEGYVKGKWAVDGVACDGANGEILMFRPTGAFEAVDKGSLDAAGFWRVKEGIAELDVITAPSLIFDEANPENDEFFLGKIRVVPFNMTDDAFEAVGVLGEQIRRATFKRCKS